MKRICLLFSLIIFLGGCYLSPEYYERNLSTITFSNSEQLDEGNSPYPLQKKNGSTLAVSDMNHSMIVYGKQLAGWGTIEGDSASIVENLEITDDIILYAIWENKTTYEVGDRGPAGGWIFKVDSGTYYEAAKQDLKVQISTDPDKFRTEHTWTYLDSEYSSVDPATDWTAPDKNLLKDMYSQLYKKGLGSFKTNTYWAIDNNSPHYIVDFADGDVKYYPVENACFTRLYRTF